MTNDTIQSLIFSFEDNYHLPLLQEVNKTYITATPREPPERRQTYRASHYSP